jgi:hypothetical protein
MKQFTTKPKRDDEETTRKTLLNRAYALAGMVGYNEVKRIYAKYDAILKNCTNPQERTSIGEMAVVELHRAFNCAGELVVNGKELIPAEKGFVPKDASTGKIIKV